LTSPSIYPVDIQSQAVLGSTLHASFCTAFVSGWQQFPQAARLLRIEKVG